MLLPRWFLVLNGVALLLMGGMLLSARLRQALGPRERGSAAEGILGASRTLVGVVWALCCCAAGAALLAMAAGYLPQPGQPRPSPAPGTDGGRRGPVFPTDR